MYSCAASGYPPILGGRVTKLLLLDSFDKRDDAPPVQIIVTPKPVIVIILLIFPYLTGKGDGWKHIFRIRDNLSGNNGLADVHQETVGKIGKLPKLKLSRAYKDWASIHRLNNHLLLLSKSFLCRIIYSNHSSIHGMLLNIPHRFNYQSKMLNEPQGNCFLNEPLIDYCIPKYLIFIIKIYFSKLTLNWTLPAKSSHSPIVTLYGSLFHTMSQDLSPFRNVQNWKYSLISVLKELGEFDLQKIY